MTDITAIEAAARRLLGQARRTPLLSSPFLDEIAGRRVLVKAEGDAKTRVSVLNEQGDAAPASNAERILALLNDQLK